MKTAAKKWEWLCYTYELPWKVDAAGKSIKKLSRIKMGIYELMIRTDGPKRTALPPGKGWRLELQGTGHRTNVQIHRAAPNLYIEGCILPVHSNSFNIAAVKSTGSMPIQTQSTALMDKIQVRLINLLGSGTATGSPTLTIAETLPAELLTDRSHAHA